MTNPSPAQAVLNAYAETVTEWFYDPAKTPSDVHYHARALAASIRAAVDGCSSDWMGLTVIHHLYALADELEGK